MSLLPQLFHLVPKHNSLRLGSLFANGFFINNPTKTFIALENFWITMMGNNFENDFYSIPCMLEVCQSRHSRNNWRTFRNAPPFGCWWWTVFLVYQKNGRDNLSYGWSSRIVWVCMGWSYPEAEQRWPKWDQSGGWPSQWRIIWCIHSWDPYRLGVFLEWLLP